MKTALIHKPCTAACERGSIVVVTDQQFRLLGDAATEVHVETVLPDDTAAARETPEETGPPVKKARRKKDAPQSETEG